MPRVLRRKVVRKGFTLVELLIVIAIISILLAVGFPIFSRLREKAKQTSCMSNMRQVGMQLIMYLNDKNERFPPYIVGQSSPTWTISDRSHRILVPGNEPATTPAERFVVADQQSDAQHWKTWMDCLHPYGKSVDIFTCPSHLGTVPVDMLTATPPFFGDPERYIGTTNAEPGNAAYGKYWLPSLAYNVYISEFLYPSVGGVNGNQKVRNHLPVFQNPASKIVFVHYVDQYGFILPSMVGRMARDVGFRPNVFSPATSYGPACGGPSRTNQYPTFPHNDGSIMVFADGHAKWYSRKTVAGELTCGLVCDTAAYATYPNIPGVFDGTCKYWSPEIPA